MVHKLIFMNTRKIKWFQEVREKVKSPGQTWRSWHQHSCELSWSLSLWSMSTQDRLSALLNYLCLQSAIGFTVFIQGHSIWNRQQSTINVHKLHKDLPVVIPPTCTYPWCTSVPDRDPMEALVKSWFAVHSMNSQSTNYFEDRQTYRHQHTHKQYWSFWTCKVQDISVEEKKKIENFNLHKTLEMCTSECKTQVSWAADHPLQDKQDKVFLSFLIHVSLLWLHQAHQGQ